MQKKREIFYNLKVQKNRDIIPSVGKSASYTNKSIYQGLTITCEHLTVICQDLTVICQDISVTLMVKYTVTLFGGIIGSV
jgi:hypothetical protein